MFRISYRFVNGDNTYTETVDAETFDLMFRSKKYEMLEIVD